MSTKVKNFIKIVLAKLTGDDNEVIALRNYKKASAALKAQIAVKEGELVNLQEKVEEAEENLQAATFPIEPITETETYIQNLVKAKNALEDAIENVNVLQDTIVFFNETLDSFE